MTSMPSEGELKVILFDVLKVNLPSIGQAMMISNVCARELHNMLLAWEEKLKKD